MPNPWLQGASRALTLVPGIAPIGALFGAAAVAAGFSPAAAVALSAFVFAGGAQFAAVGLVASGGTALAAAALVAVVNSRYFLLSAATLDLARRAGASPLQRILLALGVVDETYALQAAWSSRRGAPSDARDARDARDALGVLLAIPLTLWLVWIAATLVGALAGSRVPDVAPYGLDYALPGIFVGLLGIFADTRERLAAGLFALAVAGALAWFGYGTLAVLVVPPLLAFALGRVAPAQ